MKNFLKLAIIFLLVLSSSLGHGQTSIGFSIPSKHFKIEKYVIYIDNEDAEVYFSCLEYLEHSSRIKVFAVCEERCLIGFRATYNSYDNVKGVLMHEFPDMILFRKDNEFLESECLN